MVWVVRCGMMWGRRTFSGCSMKRKHGHLGESMEGLWLQGPRGGR